VSGYVFRAYHALPPLSTSRGEPTQAVLGFANMLLKMVKDQRPVYFAIAVDPSGPSFRKDIFEGYKATRRAAPPDLYQQMARCYEIARAYAVPMLERPGFEADDMIATVVKKARERGMRVVIVSSDKDLLQLVGDGVVMWDTMRDRVYDAAATKEKMGVPPEQVRDYLALVGDSSDNVPGVPKVGPKTAVALLEAYGSLEGVYDNVASVEKKSIKKTLEDNRDNAFLSQKLVTLKDDIDYELDLGELTWTGGSPEKLRPLFQELELYRLLDQLAPPPPKVQPAETVVTVLDGGGLDEVVRACREAKRLVLFTAIDHNDALRGELVGLAVSAGGDRAWYVPLSHHYLGAPKMLSRERVLEVLGPLLEDAALPKLSEDLKRDEIVLRRHGVTLRGARFDTTLASYLLDAGRHAHDLDKVALEELDVTLPSYDRTTDKQRGSQHDLYQVEVERGAEYAGRRVAAAWAVSRTFEPRIEAEGFSGLMYDIEVPLAHVLAVMETTGVRIDAQRLISMGRDMEVEISALEKRCHGLAGKEFNVGSPRQLETILFDELGLRVIKRTKTARSTDHDVLEELAEEHDLPAAIVEHRTLSKLKSTYLDALPKQVDKQTGRVHTVYNQSVAATGRLSSSDPNLQNIPIRTEIGRKIRDAFIPEDRWSLLSADYSQIELRILAHLSHDPELVEAFRGQGADVHARTASAIFGVEAGDVTREQRGAAKTVNYAVIYGQSHFALARNLKIERREAMRYIEAFFEKYAGVKSYMETVIEEARRSGATRTILDRRRALPDLNSRNVQLRRAAERVARNTPIQGSAADVMKIAMVRIHRDLEERRMKSRMILTVHDELVFEAPPEERDPLEALVLDRMQNAMALDVPLIVDHGWGETWGKAH
jgi:DNA polymerase-1